MEYALRHRHVFGKKPVADLKSLFRFSYIARYAAQVYLNPDGSREKTVDVNPANVLACSRKNLEEIHKRLSRIIQQTRQLLGKHAPPGLPDLLPLQPVDSGNER